jgi:hypothetical protein
MMTKTRILIAIGILSLSVSGCGKKDGLTSIGGSIVFDGHPVEKGMIRFTATDGSTPTAAATIADGKYAVKTPPGNKRVEIEAFKVVGQRFHRNDPKGAKLDVLQQILPERYNAKTELTCDVQLSQHVYDFALKK